MDFSNRNPQAEQMPPAGESVNVSRKGHHRPKFSKNGFWGRVATVAIVAAVVILIVGLIGVVFANNDSGGDYNESKYVYTDKLQAVFLNTGQVYFGNIKELNSQYYVLTNIFYLQTNNSSGSSSSSSSSSSSNNVTLVKLGCELHMPYDQMVINASEVTFWENLQSNGQVAKAVATWQRENPNGQQCADQSTSSSNTSGSSVQSGKPNQ
ncbi:MAG TPA: hypothetical protein VL989_03440 [Candidatus Sulfotelmatobacter sp.]|nr:hypothetical protein [Candidatus Sulfotelmatobacter sp.]